MQEETNMADVITFANELLSFFGAFSLLGIVFMGTLLLTTEEKPAHK